MEEGETKLKTVSKVGRKYMIYMKIFVNNFNFMF